MRQLALPQPRVRPGLVCSARSPPWEPRSCRTLKYPLFLVYTRQQSELPWEGPSSPPANLAPRALGPGPTVDTVMVKWTYWWSP